MANQPDVVRGHLTFLSIGTKEFGEVWELQKRLHAATVEGRIRGAVILVEHPPVVTLGKHANSDFIPSGASRLKEADVGLYKIDRGGEVTAHEPGQLVAYPILRLGDFGLTPKKYVACLERSVIETVAAFGLRAGTDPDYPGVWVDGKKVCAVGVRIKDRVSMHGIGFNVCNDLETFGRIIPCGISTRGVTTLSGLLGRDVSVGQVARVFTEKFARKLAVGGKIVELPGSLQCAIEDLIISV